jgi:hypothetical protein
MCSIVSRLNTQEAGMLDNVTPFPIARTPQAARSINAALEAAEQTTLTDQDREIILSAVLRGLEALGCYRLVYVAAD